MPLDIQRVFPSRTFFQGDTWSFRVILPNYDANDWTVTYTLRKQGQPAFTIVSSPAIDGTFLMEVQASVTATYAPGLYYAAATISDGATRTTLGQVELLVKADLATVPSADPRSANRKALEDVEAALMAGAGSDVVEYTIGGTTVKKDRPGLLALRSFYVLRVRAEDGKPALGNVLYSL